jgi:hypothetical protein
MRLLITTDTIGGVWIFSKNWCEDFSITTALSPWSSTISYPAPHL